jgi:FtsP/CotA-like multicopper oxidase with cupredoxin domain
MGLAERADVIVDFRGLPNGTIVTMFNTGPDAPFGGFPAVPVADPATTGQVMRCVVNNALLGARATDELRGTVKPWPVLNPTTAATPPESLVLGPVDGGTVTLAPGSVPRQLALIEEESGLICVNVDFLTGAITPVSDTTSATGYEIPLGAGVCPTPTALPMAPKAAVLGTVAAGVPKVTLWSDPIKTTVAKDSSETWEFHNFTIDAHPIHVHEVKFQVKGRRGIAGGPSIVAGRGIVNGLQAWENGWKDTVLAYPGEVTSIAANFGIAGLYVWHCHIVEHEDNEMMVPYCIDDPSTPVEECPRELF